MQVFEKETKKWGRVLWLSDTYAEIGVALEFGLRIVHISCPGMENLCYEQPKDLSDGFTTADGWRLYGGHRLWMAPESNDSYYPDNSAVTYRQEAGSVLVEQSTDPWLGIRKQLRITFQNGCVDVENILINDTTKVLEGASWGVNTLAAGGKAMVGFPDSSSSEFVPRRVVSLWGDTNLHDDRICFTRDSLTATHKPSQDYFKIGLYCNPGKAVFENKGQRFTLTFGSDELENHPDNGCNFELYMCTEFMELETLGIKYSLNPGETMSHTETWQLETL